MLFFIREPVPGGLSVTPSKSLALMAEINTAVFKLTILWLYWCCQEDIIKIINFANIVSNRFCNNDRYTLKSRLLDLTGKIIFFCWCIFYPIVTFISNLFWISNQFRNGKSAMAVHLENLRKPFFLNHFMDEVSTNQPLSIFQSTLSVWSAVTSFNQHVFYLSRVIIVMLPLITLWPLVTKFTSKLHDRHRWWKSSRDDTFWHSL